MLGGIASAPGIFPLWLKWAAPAGIAVTLALLSPPVLHRISGGIFRLTGREQPGLLPGYGKMLGLTAMYVVPGLLQGLGLYALLLSLGPVRSGSYLTITGAYYTAGLAGMLAIFAPGGLGVREGILMLVLPLVVPKESAIIAALLLRLVMISAELFLAGIFSAAAVRAGK
jgi:glycosyltransferase 2 family protein